MDSKPNNDNGSTGCHKRWYSTAHDWFIEIECETMNINLDTQKIWIIRLDGNQMIRIKPNMLTIAYNLK